MRYERIVWAAAILFAATSSWAHEPVSPALREAERIDVPAVGDGVDATPEFMRAGASGGGAAASSLPSRYQTDSPAVNGRLQSCLQKLNCRITGSAGIRRDPKPSNRCMPGRSQWSCHLIGEAIDITSATCSMVKLRDCLEGVRFRACWKGKGGCLSESGVLHFGNHEAICAPKIYAKYGSCKG